MQSLAKAHSRNQPALVTTTFLNSRGGCLQKLQLYMQYSVNVQSAVYFVIGFPFVRFLIISTILILNTEEVWEKCRKTFFGDFHVSDHLLLILYPIGQNG